MEQGHTHTHTVESWLGGRCKRLPSRVCVGYHGSKEMKTAGGNWRRHSMATSSASFLVGWHFFSPVFFTFLFFFFIRLQYAAYTQRQRAAYALFRIFRLAGPSTRSPTAAAVAGKPWKAHLLDFIGTANVFYLFFFHTAAFSFTFSQVICIIIVVSAFIVRVRVCVYVCTCESLCEFEPC